MFKNELSDKTMVVLSRSLSDRHCGLTKVNLAHNSIGDQGGVRFGEALVCNTALVKMNLSDNKFTDTTALEIINGVRSNDNVTILDLSMNVINKRLTEQIQERLDLNKFKSKKNQVPI